nr:MAG TPA: hypothetical protein [Caudoviricetes sp.]DAU51012.1 MAG TPA: hypothetical protein [Caudoviricetes sp.]
MRHLTTRGRMVCFINTCRITSALYTQDGMNQN